MNSIASTSKKGLENGNQLIVWDSVSNINYQVLATTNLNYPMAPISPILPASGPSSFYFDDSPDAVGKFYRIQVVPYALARAQDHVSPDWEAGIDARYAITATTAIYGTLYPDFATVEADQEQINSSRGALQLAERTEKAIAVRVQAARTPEAELSRARIATTRARIELRQAHVLWP